MRLILLVVLCLFTGFTIGSSLEAVNPHRTRGGMFTPWIAGFFWALDIGFALFVFSLKK